jgi:hypothetical protein
MAENPRLPPLLLAQLAADDNPFVAFRAQRTILSMQPKDHVELHITAEVAVPLIRLGLEGAGGTLSRAGRLFDGSASGSRVFMGR